MSQEQLQQPKKKRGWPLGKPRKPKSLLEDNGNETKKEDELSVLERLLNIIRGKADIKNHIRLLLDPDRIETSTRLTRSEVDFVSLSFWVAKEFPELQPLEDYAAEFCFTAISFNGLGREDAIRFEGAISESKVMQKLGIFKSEEKPQMKV